MDPRLELFPYTTQTIDATVKPYLAQKIANVARSKRRKFIPANEINKALVRELIEALHDYDEEPTDTAMTRINTALSNANMGAYRFKQYPGRVFFYPITEQSKSLIGMCLFWYFGKPRMPLDPASESNPVSCHGFTDEHEGKDGTNIAATSLFFETSAKYMISNTVNSRTGAKDKSGHYISDGAHSFQTMLTVAMQKLNSLYPYFAIMNIHGMSYKGEYKGKAQNAMHMLIVNNFNGKFTRKYKSFPTLLALAATTSNFNYNTLWFYSDLPGQVKLDNGVTAPRLATKAGYSQPVEGAKIPLIRIRDTALFKRPSGSHSSNTLARIVHSGTQARAIEDSGRSAHLELDPHYRMINSSYRQKLIQAINLAMRYWIHYRHELHNVWGLQSRNPSIFQDLTKYQELFAPEFLAQNVINMASISNIDPLFADDVDEIDPNSYESDVDEEESDVTEFLATMAETDDTVADPEDANELSDPEDIVDDEMLNEIITEITETPDDDAELGSEYSVIESEAGSEVSSVEPLPEPELLGEYQAPNTDVIPKPEIEGIESVITTPPATVPTPPVIVPPEEIPTPQTAGACCAPLFFRIGKTVVTKAKEAPVTTSNTAKPSLVS